MFFQHSAYQQYSFLSAYLASSLAVYSIRNMTADSSWKILIFINTKMLIMQSYCIFAKPFITKLKLLYLSKTIRTCFYISLYSSSKSYFENSKILRKLYIRFYLYINVV